MKSTIMSQAGRAALGTALSMAFGMALVSWPMPAAAARATANAAQAPIPVIDLADCPAKDKLPPGADLSFWNCNVAVIGAGRLQLGKIDQQITQPIKLSYALGFDPVTLEQKLVVGPLRAAPIKVPGGVFGIPGSDPVPLLQIFAQPQLAGTPEFPDDAGKTLVRLPLRIKVINPLLGETCYIGSKKTPVLLNLITGTTTPPAPNKPITGKPAEQVQTNPTVLKATGVDNSFAVPKSSGCGPNGILNGIADFRGGLPSAAGRNTAVLDQYIRFESYQNLP